MPPKSLHVAWLTPVLLARLKLSTGAEQTMKEPISTNTPIGKCCNNEVLQEDISKLTSGSATPAKNKKESSGGDNDYWIAKITNPKRLEPCEVECEDLIELFQMTFQEGEAFKALWRNGQMRIGMGKPDDSHLRNAQKVRHFGGRMEVIEERHIAAIEAP